MELLWQNGEVVLQSQNNKKPNLGESNNKFKQTSRDPNNPNQGGERISWSQCPIAEAFEKEFCSKFLSDIPSSNPIQGQNLFNFGPSGNTVLQSPRQPDFGINSLPPPRFPSFGGSDENRNMGDIAEIVDPLKGQRSMRQCSTVTIGSSHCGSNQVVNDLDISRASSCGIGGNNNPWRDRTEKEMLEQPIASSSGGSGSSSLWKASNQSNDSSRLKRKSMDESECRSDVCLVTLLSCFLKVYWIFYILLSYVFCFLYRVLSQSRLLEISRFTNQELLVGVEWLKCITFPRG